MTYCESGWRATCLTTSPSKKGGKAPLDDACSTRCGRCCSEPVAIFSRLSVTTHVGVIVNSSGGLPKITPGPRAWVLDLSAWNRRFRCPRLCTKHQVQLISGCQQTSCVLSPRKRLVLASRRPSQERATPAKDSGTETLRWIVIIRFKQDALGSWAKRLCSPGSGGIIGP